MNREYMQSRARHSTVNISREHFCICIFILRHKTKPSSTLGGPCIHNQRRMQSQKCISILELYPYIRASSLIHSSSICWLLLKKSSEVNAEVIVLIALFNSRLLSSPFTLTIHFVISEAPKCMGPTARCVPPSLPRVPCHSFMNVGYAHFELIGC